jgi:glucose/mannose-6-phosphate isomerase
VLDHTGAIERGDPHRAREALGRFPIQCREALALRPEPPPRLSHPSLVVLAGMGGSAAGADLVATWLADRLTVPVLVHRGYGLPGTAGAGTLVVVSSYSGETAETVSACESALKSGASTLVVTNGGRLGALAESHGLPWVRLPAGLMPRMALGYLFFPLVRALEEAAVGAIPRDEVDEALEVVETLASALGPSSPTAANDAKRLALDVGGRMPVIYGGQVTAGAAYRWKTDLEENAKRFAVAGAVPEMNHNEIEAWRAPDAARLHAIFLRADGEPPEIARRFAVVRALIEPVAGGVSEVWARGAGRLARLLSLIYLGQWVSYYLALLGGVDPWAVPILEEVKRRLRPA